MKDGSLEKENRKRGLKVERGTWIRTPGALGNWEERHSIAQERGCPVSAGNTFQLKQGFPNTKESLGQTLLLCKVTED